MNNIKSDIVFVFPPANGNRGVFKGHLGSAYLRAALAQAGIYATQYINDCPRSIDDVATDILRPKSPIVGFTTYDANVPLCIAIAESIKKKSPGVQVVFGGPAATFNAQRLLEKHSAIDVCVLGEAEETGTEIFTKLLDHKSLEIKAGVAVRRDGEVMCTPLPPLVGSKCTSVESALDARPSPYLSGVLSDGRLGVLTGRGCTHLCQYCCFAALGRKRLRLHSIERVLAELTYIEAHQKRTGEQYVVAIHDDAFTLLSSRTKTLCQAIIDHKLNLAFSCITRADTVDKELIHLMREAGFISFAFGLESAVPSVLRATGKVRPPDWHDPDLEPEKQFIRQVRSSVLTAKRYGFNVGVSIILGLPTETAADGTATLRFVRHLPIDYYMHNFLWLFPGTPLWETHEKFGIECGVNEIGLATTTGYAYDIAKLRPQPKCALEQDAQLVRLLTTDALYGCSAPSAGANGTSTIVIRSGEVTAETGGWLRKTLTVGGMVVQIYPLMNRTARSLSLIRDRCVLSECFVPARHHVQLVPKQSTGEDRSWQIACAGIDLYRTHKPALVSIESSTDDSALMSWIKDERTSAVICDISEAVKHPGKLVHLSNQLEPRNGESPMQRLPIPPEIKYPGRWLKGRLRCRSLTRIEIDSQGKIRCCEHGEPIGQVGDSKTTIFRQLNQIIYKTEQRRGCAKCSIHNCPRCPFPGMDDAAYCRIITKQEHIQNSLTRIRLYSRLPLLVALHKDEMAAE